jgi:hypothetical protein
MRFARFLLVVCCYAVPTVRLARPRGWLAVTAPSVVDGSGCSRHGGREWPQEGQEGASKARRAQEGRSLALREAQKRRGPLS